MVSASQSLEKMEKKYFVLVMSEPTTYLLCPDSFWVPIEIGILLFFSFFLKLKSIIIV